MTEIGAANLGSAFLVGGQEKQRLRRNDEPDIPSYTDALVQELAQLWSVQSEQAKMVLDGVYVLFHRDNESVIDVRLRLNPQRKRGTT